LKINDPPNGEDSSLLIETQARLESFLFFRSSPVKLGEICGVLHLSPSKVIQIIRMLRLGYNSSQSALEIAEPVKNEFLLQIQPKILRYSAIRKFTRGSELTPQEISCLAHIAFHQPVDEQDLLDFTGRGSKLALKHLLAKGFIACDSITYPILDKRGREIQYQSEIYRTTSYFATYFDVENTITSIQSHIQKRMK